MGENMKFPDDSLDFIKGYSFKDKEEIYTNGSMLVPLFRVEQMIDHYIKNNKNNYWVSCEDKEVIKWMEIPENNTIDCSEEVINNITESNSDNTSSVATINVDTQCSYEKAVKKYLDMGYKLSSSSCGKYHNNSYGCDENYWMAIMVKEGI